VPSQEVGGEVVATIERRTPAFSGWQQERWLFRCGDGAMFLCPVGARELAGDQGALDSLRQELSEGRWEHADVERFLAALDKDAQPTAYLFACRHCGAHLVYSDST
jgi:uncharacterized protein CbrC (UPF0167 family)